MILIYCLAVIGVVAIVLVVAAIAYSYFGYDLGIEDDAEVVAQSKWNR